MSEEKLHDEIKQELRIFNGKFDIMTEKLNNLAIQAEGTKKAVEFQNGRVTKAEGAISENARSLKTLADIVETNQENQNKMFIRFLTGVSVAFGATIISMAVFIFFDKTTYTNQQDDAIQNFVEAFIEANKGNQTPYADDI